MSPPRFRRPTGAFPAGGDDATPQPVPSDLDAHRWGCWGAPDGPGVSRLAEVHREIATMKTEVAAEHEKTREEISSIKGRIAWFNGGTAVVTTVVTVILAAWLSSKFAATERNAVKREDVAAAVQKSAEMVANKKFDDAVLLRQMLDKAAVDVALPNVSPMMGKVRK